MSSFDYCRKIEAMGMADIEPWLASLPECRRFVTFSRGKCARELQREYGDLAFNTRSGRIVCADVKVEVADKHGNFFIETVSNKADDGRIIKAGWYCDLQCDYIFYYFLEQKDLYSIDFGKLRRWLGSPVCRNRFPEKEQRLHPQLNSTWGWCVPIRIVEREIGFRFWNLSQQSGGMKFNGKVFTPERATA